MKAKTIVMLMVKVIILIIVMFILFSVGTSLGGFQSDTSQMTREESGMAALALLVVCLIDVLILIYLILRSRLAGVRLMLMVAIVFYGVKTFMSQIEAWYFMPNISPEMLPSLFLMTVPIAVFFPPLAVFILGKHREDTQHQETSNVRLVMPVREWAWKLAVLAGIIYPLLFFGFGYFVAWQNPELRAFYGGTDPGNVFTHYINTFSADPKLYPFEVFRGLLWIGLAIPVIRTLKGHPWEAGLLVALLFSLLMNDMLILPNLLMPPSVRFSHFIETASSNFIWAWIIVGLLLWRPKHTAEDKRGKGDLQAEMA